MGWLMNFSFTEFQLTALVAAALGETTLQTSQRLGVSESAVKTARRQVLKKTNSRSIASAVFVCGSIISDRLRRDLEMTKEGKSINDRAVVKEERCSISNCRR